MERVRIKALFRDDAGRVRQAGFRELSARTLDAGLPYSLALTQAAHDLLINVADPRGDDDMVEQRTRGLVASLAETVRKQGLELNRRYRFSVDLPDRNETDRYELVARFTKVAFGTEWMLVDRAGARELV